MSATFPLILFLLVFGVWLATTLQSNALLNLFRNKYPKEAARDIPCAFSWSRHPEKLFFFFRKRSRPLLKSDPEVWRLRQRVKMLLFLSVLVPVGGFLIIACAALPHIFK